MKLARPFSALAVVGALSLGGCNGTSTLTLDDLAGTWIATSLLFAAQSDATIQFDLIAVSGQFSIVLTAAGGYTTSLTPPGGAAEVENGTIALTNASEFMATGTLTEPGGDTDVFQFEKIGNTVTLSGTGEFQFPGTAAEIPVNITAVLTRQ